MNDGILDVLEIYISSFVRYTMVVGKQMSFLNCCAGGGFFLKGLVDFFFWRGGMPENSECCMGSPVVSYVCPP